MEIAREHNIPIIAFVHGSDWNRHGEKLRQSMWLTDETDALFRHRSVVLLDVDVLQSPTETDADAQRGRHNLWKKKGLRTYPAIIALQPNGAALGARQGNELPSNPILARDQVFELGKASIRSLSLRAIIASASTSEDPVAEHDAIHQLVELPLNRPTKLLKRLAEIDPADEDGVRRRLSMPPWNTFVAQATNDAKAGRSVEAIARLTAMLDANVYTPEQQAWICVALGSVHRHTAGHETEAAESFRRGQLMAPDTLAGNAGRRLYLVLYAEPSLETGFASRHCFVERTTWTLADAPERLAKGTHTLTLSFGRGRHALHVDRVECVDPTTLEVIAVDSHRGQVSKHPAGNTYTLHLDEPLDHPIIRIHGQTDGGTNASGTITLEGPEAAG